MPELPEVETVKNYLTPVVLNKEITEVFLPPSRLLDKQILYEQGLEQRGQQANEKKGLDFFKNKLVGSKILKIERRGKYLLFYLSKKISLVFHLGMTGKFIVVNEGINLQPTKLQPIKLQPIKVYNPKTHSPVFHDNGLANGVNKKKHLYFSCWFKDKMNLNFYDPRTFGKILLVSNPDPKTHPSISSLGLEPLVSSTKKLNQVFPLRSSRKIKAWLLDQRFLAGVGNIYADETLFAARVNPLRLASSIKEKEWKKIVVELRKILRRSIRNLGSTISSFRNPQDGEGSFQEHLKVYGREGLPCVRCKEKLVALKVGGRTTVYCPACQSD